MTDEMKTILRIEGDASGAVKAAKETSEAIKRNTAATKELQAAEEAMAGAVGKFEETATGVGNVKKATDATNEAFNRGRQGANVLAEAISRINPEAGNLIRTVGNLDNLMGAAFSPAGLMTGGLLAALTAVAAIVSTIQESIAEAKQQLADMEAAKARLARDKLEAAGEVGKGLAAHGAGSEEALERATEQAQKAEKEGFERGAAVQVAAATEAAGLTLGDEERRRLTMGVQLGAVDIGKGRTPAETRATLEKAMGGLGGLSPDLQAAIEAGIEQTMRGKNLGSMREAEKGTEGFLEDALRKMGLEGETLADRSAKVREALKGPRTKIWTQDDFGNAVARPETQAEFERLNAEGLNTLDQLRRQTLDKEKQLAAQQDRVLQIVMSTPGGTASADPASWGETFREADTPSNTTRRRASHSYRTERPSFDPDTQNQPITVNNHFSGINNIGTRDPRLLRKPRMSTK